MAFTNIPPSFQDIFNGIYDRLIKVETRSLGDIGGWSAGAQGLYAQTTTSAQWELNSYDGQIFAQDINAANIIGGKHVVAGTTGIDSFARIWSRNGVIVDNYLQLFSISTSANAANLYYNTTTNFVLRSTASSQRYKHDIVDLDDVPELDPTALYNLPVRAFRFNDDYIAAEDDRAGVLIPGFIAEEMDEIYPAAADYAGGGEVESWNDRILIPAMLKLIQQQNDRITELESRL